MPFRLRSLAISVSFILTLSFCQMIANSPSLDKWDKTAHPMKKNEFGVFELIIPPTADGQPAIAHNSKIKVWQTRSVTVRDSPRALTPYLGHPRVAHGRMGRPATSLDQVRDSGPVRLTCL